MCADQNSRVLWGTEDSGFCCFSKGKCFAGTKRTIEDERNCTVTHMAPIFQDVVNDFLLLIVQFSLISIRIIVINIIQTYYQ